MIDLSSVSSRLRRDATGVWSAAEHSERVSYPEHGAAELMAVEDRSFWFRHRNRCIVAAVEAHLGDQPLFDIGGGNGFVAQGLAAEGREVVLVEPSRVGAANAIRRGLSNVVCATLEAADFKPACAPAVGVFDVVEHVEDDVGFVRQLAALLTPGGFLFATVPAHAWLWSREDESAGHFRRYSLEHLRALLRASGLAPVYLTMFFRPLPLPIMLLRAVPSALGFRGGAGSPAASREREHATGGGLLVRALERLLAPEVAHIRMGRVMAFGASILAVAAKPGGRAQHRTAGAEHAQRCQPF